MIVSLRATAERRGAGAEALKEVIETGVEIRRLIKRHDDSETLRPAETRKIARFTIIGGELYRRGFSTPLLKCLAGEETQYVMDELHNGICGFHTGG